MRNLSGRPQITWPSGRADSLPYHSAQRARKRRIGYPRRIPARKGLFIATLALLGALGGLAVNYYFLPAEYETETYIQIAPTGTRAAGGRIAYLETEVKVLESARLRDKTAAKIQERTGQPAWPPVETRVRLTGDGNLIELAARSPNAKLAALYANTLAKEYVAFRMEADLERARQASLRLSTQIREAARKLAASEAALREYRSLASLPRGKNNHAAKPSAAAEPITRSYSLFQVEAESNRRIFHELARRAREGAEPTLRARNIAILQPAPVPHSPTWPNRVFNVLAGCFIGLIAAFGSIYAGQWPRRGSAREGGPEFDAAMVLETPMEIVNDEDGPGSRDGSFRYAALLSGGSSGDCCSPEEAGFGAVLAKAGRVLQALRAARNDGPGLPNEAIPFATGGCTAQGGISLTLELPVGAGQQPPAPAPQRIGPPPRVPSLRDIQVGARNDSGFELLIAGDSSTPSLSGFEITFAPSAGARLAMTPVPVRVEGGSSFWFQGASGRLGSRFRVSMFVSVRGSVEDIESVSVRASNSSGSSPACTVSLN